MTREEAFAIRYHMGFSGTENGFETRCSKCKKKLGLLLEEAKAERRSMCGEPLCWEEDK